MDQKSFSTGPGSLEKAELEETMDGLDRTSCASLFQSEVVLGKNEYFYESTRECQNQNVESYE